ncbi:MAG: hypothetical protein J0L92_40760 [Deltaproteobacteria bacterium]|nr:hypothetical protein [Deltaproteobacteria bacterium]
MRRARPFLALGLLACAACTARPVTEVVLEVQTSYAVPTALDRVRIETTRAGSTTTTSMGAWTDASVPRVLGLVHEGGALGPVDVVVVGMLGTSAIVERRATFTFVEGEIRRLVLRLVPECATALGRCAPPETCDEGPVCRDPHVWPEELLVWTDQEVSSDAQSLPDAGATDALDCCPSSVPNAVSTSCATGACAILACEPLYAHCDTSMRNGCETRLDTRADCGACGTRCPSGTACELAAGSYACR